jgi:RNA polymerase sigma-70 factor (ECF subfamily)
MTSDTTSPSLLLRVRDPADRAAWHEFDGRYGELIVRYCRRCGLQHSDAEDIRQLVMIRLSRAMGGFHYDPRRGRFRTFMGCIVRNEIARYLGRPNLAAAGVDKDGGPAEPADDEAPDDRWESEWMHHHLRLAMGRIRSTFDARSLEVFERLLAGDSVEAVSRAFGLSTDAVHKVKQRVRDRLQAFVAAQVLEEDQPHE